MAESQALAEVPEEIHHPEIHQEVGNFMDLGVLGLTYLELISPIKIGSCSLKRTRASSRYGRFYRVEGGEL